MAYQESQWRVCVEFLRANKPGHGRIIRLNHAPSMLPPQLNSRIHPIFWQIFIEEAGQLSLKHPYTAKPAAKDYCNWAACFGLGAVAGLFCISPDAGDYAVWEQECGRFMERWKQGWEEAGCTLSLQRHRDYWLQIDINPSFVIGQPVSPPMPPRVPSQPPQLPFETQGSGDQQPASGKPPKVV